MILDKRFITIEVVDADNGESKSFLVFAENQKEGFFLLFDQLGYLDLRSNQFLSNSVEEGELSIALFEAMEPLRHYIGDWSNLLHPIGERLLFKRDHSQSCWSRIK